MSHLQQKAFVNLVKKEFPTFFEHKKVLEVGSLDINGTIRDIFYNCEYTGCDVSSGKGVDLVVQGQLIEYPTNYFDVVISTECFEHNPFWIETFSNML